MPAWYDTRHKQDMFKLMVSSAAMCSGVCWGKWGISNRGVNNAYKMFYLWNVYCPALLGAVFLALKMWNSD